MTSSPSASRAYTTGTTGLPLSPPRSPEPFPSSAAARSNFRASVASAADTLVSSDHDHRVSLSAPVSPTSFAFPTGAAPASPQHVTLATSTPIPVLVSRPCSSSSNNHAKFAKRAVYRWAIAVRTPRHAALHLSKSPALCLPGLAAQSLTLPPACAIAVVENDPDLCGPVPDACAALVLESPHASFLWELRNDAMVVDTPVVEPTAQILIDWPLAKVVAMAATPDAPLVFSPPPLPLSDSGMDGDAKRKAKRDKRMSSRRRSSSASVATMVDQGPIIVRALRAQDAHSMAEVLSGRRTPTSISSPPPFPTTHLPASPNTPYGDSIPRGGGGSQSDCPSPVTTPTHPMSPITPTIPRRGPESIIGAAAHYQRAVSPGFPSPPFSPRMGYFGSPAMSTRRPSGESTVSSHSGSGSGSRSSGANSVPNSPLAPHGHLDQPLHSRGRRPSTQFHPQPPASSTCPIPSASPSVRRRSLSVAAHRLSHSHNTSFFTSTMPEPPSIPASDASHLLMASPPLTPPMSNTHSPALPSTPNAAADQEDLVSELRRLHLALGSIQSNHMRVMARRRPSDSSSLSTMPGGSQAGARDCHSAVPPPRSRSVGPAVNQREATRALMSHFQPPTAGGR